MHIKCDRYSSYSAYRWVPRSSLKIAQVAAFQVGTERQLLLGQTGSLPQVPDILSQKGDQLHCRSCNRDGTFGCPLIVSFSGCGDLMWEKTVWESFRRNAEEGRSAVADLHADYGDWLLRRLTHRYGLEIAEDVVQETWLRVGPLTASSYIAHPKALLLTIASNLARNMGVKQAVRNRHATEIVAGSHEEPSQQAQVLAQQLLLGLPVPLRDVFVLSRIVGLTNVQIAEKLGISPKTVEGRMTKAFAHCAAQLRR